MLLRSVDHLPLELEIPKTRSCFGVKNTKEFDCERNTTPLS